MNGQISPEIWLQASQLDPAEVDCITAVMLKILDGKCKMPPIETQIMTKLYDAAKALTGANLHDEYHQMIANARRCLPEITQSTIDEIYEYRVLAETQISRPVMKKFKARLRAEGVLPAKTK